MFNACNEITNWSHPQVITIVLNGSLVVAVTNRIDMYVLQAVYAAMLVHVYESDEIVDPQ